MKSHLVSIFVFLPIFPQRNLSKNISGETRFEIKVLINKTSVRVKFEGVKALSKALYESQKFDLHKTIRCRFSCSQKQIIKSSLDH